MRLSPHTAFHRAFPHDLRPFLHPHYRDFTGSTSTFQQQFGCLLFFVILYPSGYPLPFLVPITLSLHIPLGACYEPFRSTCPAGFPLRQVWCFIICSLTPPHGMRPLALRTFLCALFSTRTFASSSDRFGFSVILTVGTLWTPGI